MRPLLPVFVVVALLSVSGCGFHTPGAASHLPPNVRTLAIPMFANQTEMNGTQTAITEAVVREFIDRSSFRVTQRDPSDADATLRGTILQEGVTPLTFNTQTQQSSSFLVTLVLAVKLVDHSGHVLYENDHYVYRQQYQSTTNLPTFVEEDPAAVERLAYDFARQLVADVLEGF